MTYIVFWIMFSNGLHLYAKKKRKDYKSRVSTEKQ